MKQKFKVSVYLKNVPQKQNSAFQLKSLIPEKPWCVVLGVFRDVLALLQETVQEKVIVSVSEPMPNGS